MYLTIKNNEVTRNYDNKLLAFLKHVCTTCKFRYNCNYQSIIVSENNCCNYKRSEKKQNE